MHRYIDKIKYYNFLYLNIIHILFNKIWYIILIRHLIDISNIYKKWNVIKIIGPLVESVNHKSIIDFENNWW